MTISPAFQQLQSFVQAEDVMLDKLIAMMDSGSVATRILSNKDTVIGHYNAEMEHYIDAVLGFSTYIEAKISQESEEVGRLVGLGKMPIAEYNLHEDALYNYDKISDKVNALIHVLKPDARYYHKILAAILVRNYLPMYHNFVTVPRSLTPSKEQIASVSKSIDTSKLVINSTLMDKETQKYREVPSHVVVVYLASLKGLLYTLVALQGKYLTLKEINALELNFFTTNNSYFAFGEEFEFHGIRVIPDIENKYLELYLSPELANLITNEVLPLIPEYEHYYAA